MTIAKTGGLLNSKRAGDQKQVFIWPKGCLLIVSAVTFIASSISVIHTTLGVLQAWTRTAAIQIKRYEINLQKYKAPTK